MQAALKIIMYEEYGKNINNRRNGLVLEYSFTPALVYFFILI
jgi:hypothetical protein